MLTSDAYVCSVLQSDTFPYSKPPINFDNEFSKTNFIYFAAYLEECKKITVPKKKFIQYVNLPHDYKTCWLL